MEKYDHEDMTVGRSSITGKPLTFHQIRFWLFVGQEENKSTKVENGRDCTELEKRSKTRQSWGEEV